VAELNEQQTQDDLGNSVVRRSRSGFWFGIIVLLVVVALAGIGFYLLQGLRDREKDLTGEIKSEVSKQLSDYQAQLTAIQTQLTNVNKEVANKDERFAKVLADLSMSNKEQLATTRKELTDSIQKIERQLGKTRGDWLIADAEYLLSVANERLQLIGDVHTTIEALEAADQRLRESGDTGVIKVREKIAEEIATVKTINATDIVKTYVSIQAQQERVEKLTLLLPYASKAASKKTESHNEENALLGVLGVKHTEQPIEAILSAEEAKFIYEQLRVKLEIAEIALVQHHAELYQAALVDAKDWLKKHFAEDDVNRSFAEELDKFTAIKLDNQFPDISLSLKMLRDISKLRLEADKAQATDTETKKPSNEAAKPVQTAPVAEPVHAKP
jgi:uroporphyrin-III C-methyltransferase